MKTSLCICLLLALFSNAFSQDWNHAGQLLWHIDYPSCAGVRQSPIALDESQAIVPTKAIPAIRFSGYGINYASVNVNNDGHSANIVLPKPFAYIWPVGDLLLPSISGGNLPLLNKYVAESLHFHWGASDDIGSEHTINNVSYSLEGHIVHRNTKYPSVPEALKHGDGLAVLGFMYSASDEEILQPVSGLTKIVNALSSIQSYEDIAEIANFKLSDLLDNVDLTKSYFYEGSLTTPPCAEAVQWTVFGKAAVVSSADLNAFRQLTDVNNVSIFNNWRNVQPLNNRPVYMRA